MKILKTPTIIFALMKMTDSDSMIIGGQDHRASIKVMKRKTLKRWKNILRKHSQILNMKLPLNGKDLF
jgi:hypothetical protein